MDAIAGGWDLLTKADEVATKLRVRHLQDQPLDVVRRGTQTCCLAASLLQEMDIILLDKHTNFFILGESAVKVNKKLTLSWLLTTDLFSMLFVIAF